MSSSTTVCRSSTSSSSFDPQETAALKFKVLLQQNPNHHQTIIHDNLGSSLQKNPSNKSHNYSHHNDQYSCNNNAIKACNNSFSRLSPKSLELCTEKLGSETGSETIFIAGYTNQEPSAGKKLLAAPEPENLRSNTVKKFQKSPCDRTFPPPLTTMSGSSPLQVTRHRENGRLIIEAVERPLRNGVLKAQRSGGRLRLRFLNAPPVDGGEEKNRNEVFVDDDDDDGVNNDTRNQYHRQWIGRCKEGRRRGGDNNGGDGVNWNQPALWVVTS